MRLTSPPDISQYLVYTDVLLDIVVSGAPVLIRQFRTRRWGKLHRQGLRTPLPSIHLANLHSLPNKTDALFLLSRLNKDFFKLCCSAFHGNLAEWRHSRQRTSSSELSADQIWSQSRTDGEITWRRDVLLHQWEVVYRRNSVKEGVLFWSRNAPHQLQAVQTRCKFCSFILMSVYILLQVHMSSALQKLADLITDTEQQHPDSVLLILGTLIKQISPVNCQNTDNASHVPTETVIYWITVTQQ